MCYMNMHLIRAAGLQCTPTLNHDKRKLTSRRAVRTSGRRILLQATSESANAESEDENVSKKRNAFQRVDPSSEEPSQPEATGVALGLWDILDVAFQSYETPKVYAFKEYSHNETEILHLDAKAAAEADFDILKITPKELLRGNGQDTTDYCVAFKSWTSKITNLQRNDGKQETSSTNEVTDASENREKEPVWGKTLYLVNRKNCIYSGADQMIDVELHEDPSSLPWWRFGRRVHRWGSSDSLVGKASLTPSDFIKQHSIEFDPVSDKKKNKIKDMKLEYDAEILSVTEESFPLNGSSVERTQLDSIETERDVTSQDSSPDGYLENYKGPKPTALVFVDSLAGAQAWILANADTNIAFVSFRGTQVEDARDVVTDIRICKTSLKEMSKDEYIIQPTDDLTDCNLKVHRGFHGSYESVRETILQVLYDLTNWNAKWTVCLTGHSLGGALASLCAFEIANRRIDNDQRPKIMLCNFGAPRVGNKDYAAAHDRAEIQNFRVVNEFDPVPFLPLFYQHHGAKVVTTEIADGLKKLESKPLFATFSQLSLSPFKQVKIVRDLIDFFATIFAWLSTRLSDLIKEHSGERYTELIYSSIRDFLIWLSKED